MFAGLLIVGFLLAAVGCGVYLLRHRQLIVPVRLGADADPAAVSRLARLRRRNCVLVAVALFLLAVSLWWASGASPYWPAVLAVMAASAAVPLVVMSVQPDPVELWRTDHGGVRRADLERRSPRRFGPSWGFTLPIATTLVLIVFLVWCGVVSARESGQTENRRLAFSGDGWITWVSPFPGWYYGLPLMLSAVVVLALTLLALHRIARCPAPSTPGAREADRFVRELSARFAMKLSSFVLVGFLGGAAYYAGSAYGSVAGAIGSMASQDPAGVPSGGLLHALAVVLSAGGVILVAVSLVLLASAVMDAIAPVRQVRAVGAVRP